MANHIGSFNPLWRSNCRQPESPGHAAIYQFLYALPHPKYNFRGHHVTAGCGPECYLHLTTPNNDVRWSECTLNLSTYRGQYSPFTIYKIWCEVSPWKQQKVFSSFKLYTVTVDFFRSAPTPLQSQIRGVCVKNFSNFPSLLFSIHT